MKKKIAVVVLLALGAALLFWWTQVRKDLILSEKDLIPAIQRTVGTDAPLTVFEEYDNGPRDTRLLLCYRTDSVGEIALYAARLEKAWVGYKCYRASLVERGPNIYVATWSRGEIFVIGNPDTAYIQITRTSPAGETMQIPVTGVPFSYYWDWNEEPWRTDATSASYEYFFFDKAGKEIK